MAQKINNTESLDQEIRRLQAKADKLEEKLDESLDYLQDNYSSMIMNSVLSKAAGGFKGGVAGTVLSFLLGNEKLMGAFSKIANHLVEKAAAGIDILADKLTKSKD